TLTHPNLTPPPHARVTLNANLTFSHSHHAREPTLVPYTTLFRSNGTTNGSPDAKCSPTATVSITVTPVNDAPVANNDSAAMDERGAETASESKSGSDLASGLHAEGNTLTATKLSNPAHGSVTLNA